MKDLAIDPISRDLLIPGQLVDAKDHVKQSLAIRLMFYLGEWFLDQFAGVPYYQEVFGKQPRGIGPVDAVFKDAILSTPGVNQLLEFNSTLDKSTREYFMDFVVDTIFGSFRVTTESTGSAPQLPLLVISDNPVVSGV